MQKLLFVYYYSENRARSRIWKVLPNMVFPPIWGKNYGVLSSLFARLGSALIGGGKKGEYRDWTIPGLAYTRPFSRKPNKTKKWRTFKLKFPESACRKTILTAFH